jgi:hypothetical protein
MPLAYWLRISFSVPTLRVKLEGMLFRIMLAGIWAGRFTASKYLSSMVAASKVRKSA